MSSITNEARGRLRILFAALAVDAAMIRRAVAAIPSAMALAAVRPGVGSTAALNRVIGRLPCALLTRGRCMGVWRFLEPTGEPEPPAIMVMAVLLGAIRRPALAIEPFGLSFSHHALGRLSDQAGAAGAAYLSAAMLEAHDHLAVLQPADGEKLFSLGSLTVPGGPGAFLIQPRGRSTDGVPMAFAKTWLSADQLRSDQAHDVSAWSQFIAASA
jgi:hypothetical protein